MYNKANNTIYNLTAKNGLKLNNSYWYEFDSVDDYATMNRKIALGSSFAWSYWTRTDSFAANFFFGADDTTNRNFGMTKTSTGGNKFICQIFIGNAVKQAIFTGATQGVDYHVWCEYDGTNLTMYLNNTLAATIATGGGAVDNDNVNFDLGRKGDNTAFLDSPIQGLIIFKTNRSTSDRTTVFNAGKNYNPYSLAVNFTITLKDFYDNSTLTNFTADVNGTTYNDSGTGTITTDILNNNGSLFDITISKDDYFNSTYNDYSVVSNLQAKINNTNLTLRIVFNNTNITANITPTLLEDLNNSVNFTSNTGFYNINPPSNENITFRISCNLNVFQTRNVTLNFSARDENEYIIYVEPTLNTATFFDATNSSPIANATINVTYPISGDEIQLTTNATGTILFSYVKNNVTEFGNYTFEFDKLGYNLITIIEDINSTDVPAQLQYNITRSNLIINVFDRETGSLLNDTNVSLILLGVFNETTENGTLTFQNISLVAQDYTLQAISDGYGTEQRTFTYNNQDNLTIDLYLLNLTSPNAGTLFVSIIDEYYFRQVEANVNLLEYSTVENGFITISECLTNTNGECVFNIELNTKTYIIQASKTIDGGFFSAVSGTAGEIIKTDEEVRRLILRTSEDFDGTSVDNLIFNVTFNSDWDTTNVSTVFSQFQTFDNLPTTVCIEYYTVESLIETSVLVNCTTSTTGLANVGTSIALNRSKTYRVSVYNKVNNNHFELATFLYPNNISMSEVFKDEGLNRYIVLITFIGLLAISLYMKNINIFLIGCLFLPWIHRILFPNELSIKVIAAINVICIFALYVARKREQLG